MKKLKVFLTVTAFCLALAAVAAAKSNARVFALCYTEDSVTGTCTIPSGIDCNGGPFPCKDGAGNQLFHFDANNACSVLCTRP